MAAEAHSTATLRLSVGDLRVVHPITVPSGPVPAADVVQALQGHLLPQGLRGLLPPARAGLAHGG
jgi:hypothetical protein